MASLAALDFKENQDLDVYIGPLYTFGQPRIGDIKFSNYFNSKLTLFRVTNGNDLVNHLPPLKLKFYHPGVEIHYTSNSFHKYQQCVDADSHLSGDDFCTGEGKGKCSNCRDDRSVMTHLKGYYGVENHGCRKPTTLSR
eukprot:Pgem_evm1s2439